MANLAERIESFTNRYANFPMIRRPFFFLFFFSFSSDRNQDKRDLITTVVGRPELFHSFSHPPPATALAIPSSTFLSSFLSLSPFLSVFSCLSQTFYDGNLFRPVGTIFTILKNALVSFFKTDCLPKLFRKAEILSPNRSNRATLEFLHSLFPPVRHKIETLSMK